LAVTSEQRSPALPDVPTTNEAGPPKMAAATWNVIFAPAKIPQPLLARLNKEISAVQNLPEVRAQFFQPVAGYLPRLSPARDGVHRRGDQPLERRRQGGEHQARVMLVLAPAGPASG